MKLAPIVIFVYKRPLHTMQLLLSLKKNSLLKESEVYFFCEGYKTEKDQNDVNEVRRIVHAFDGCKSKSIFESHSNKGLANSVISGVSAIFESNDRVIVLEDDLVLSNDAILFLNNGLDFHEKNNSIFSISAYSPNVNVNKDYMHDTFLFQRMSSWGWATWKNRWKTIDWNVSDFKQFIRENTLIKSFNKGGDDCTALLISQMSGKVDSWAIRFNYASFKDKSYTVYPKRTKVINTGLDNSGTHKSTRSKFPKKVCENPLIHSQIQFNSEISKMMKAFYDTSVLRTIINIFKLLRVRIEKK
jgi:hypothetical protein